MQDSSYKGYLDFLRLFAILLVVFNHTPAFHFPFQSTGESLQVKLMLIISAIDKVAVPLFFMISGALLLPKRETLKSLLQKRVVRFVVVILLFHVVQSTYYCVGGGENGIGIRSFLSDSYWGSMDAGYVLGWTGAGAVWFLYAYAGLLLTLPFLRLMVKDMEEIHFLYLFGLQVALCVMCPASFVLLTGHTPDGFKVLKYLPLCGNVFVFVLAGYYAERKVCVEKMSATHFSGLVVTSVVLVLLAAWMPEWARVRMNAELVNQYIPGLTAYMLIPCLTIYLVAKKIAVSCCLNARISKVLRTLGGAVFTVMLVENILRREISTWFTEYESAYCPSVCVACVVWIVGLLLGIICKKVPFLKCVL